MAEPLRNLSCYLMLLPAAAALGCAEARPQSPSERSAPAVSAANHFDPKSAGSVSGRVTWAGPLPAVPPFEIRAFVLSGQPGQPRMMRENPNAPAVDPASRGLAGAVVFLRGVSADKARPWDHPPVLVEQRDRRLHVLQGAADSRVGFVRAGDEVEMVSREPRFHALHAGGAAFFSLTFPDPDRPRRRRLASPGLVELSSAAGYYWMRGYLFVTDHPHYTRTDAQGRFRFDGVPAGRYEVVCWHPSWLAERHDRDPETSLLMRLYFRPPVERQQAVEVAPRGEAVAAFTLATADFERAAVKSAE